MFCPHKKILKTNFKDFQIIRCPRFTFERVYRNKFCLAIWHVGLQHFWPIIFNGTIPILLCIDWNFNLDNWQFYELCIGTVYCIHRSTVSMTHQIEIQRFQKYLFMKLCTYILLMVITLNLNEVFNYYFSLFQKWVRDTRSYWKLHLLDRISKGLLCMRSHWGSLKNYSNRA